MQGGQQNTLGETQHTLGRSELDRLVSDIIRGLSTSSFCPAMYIDISIPETVKELANKPKLIITSISIKLRFYASYKCIFYRRKIKLNNGTDEERTAAYEKKKGSRARYRRRNRALLAQKAKDRRARQHQ